MLQALASWYGDTTKDLFDMDPVLKEITTSERESHKKPNCEVNNLSSNTLECDVTQHSAVTFDETLCRSLPKNSSF